MVICTTQDIKKYVSLNKQLNVEFGIGTLYKESPSLFSLISIASPILYQWEQGSPVPEDERCHGLEPFLEDMYSRSLSYGIGGLAIGDWLKMFNTPTEFYLNMNQFSLSGLPLLEFYTIDQLRLVMSARCYSWLKYQKSEQLQHLQTLFTQSDEKVVKENAYGRYAA